MSSRCRYAEITIESCIVTETNGLGGPMSNWRPSRLQEAFGTVSGHADTVLLVSDAARDASLV
jgi:hypothetical protein